jgi:putative transposase
MISSMSRPANPYDNASCESFIKTLKREEIYANEYRNLEHLRGHIEEFVEHYYNQKRLHSSLGYCPPEEFEQQSLHASETKSLASTMVFFQESTRISSTGLMGEGTQTPSLPQTPSLLKN